MASRSPSVSSASSSSFLPRHRCHSSHGAGSQELAFSLHHGYLSEGSDLLWQSMTVEEAKRKAAMLPGCKGFCFEGVDMGGSLEICFKGKWDFNASADWTSYRLEVNCQRVMVQRLTASLGGRGWKHHDRRALELSAGNLRIFDKGSSSKVKLSIDVASEVEECSSMPGAVISILLRRVPSGAHLEDGVSEHKSYIFEFPTSRSAAAFHHEILRLVAQEGC